MAFKLVQSDVITRDFEMVAPDHSVIKVSGCSFNYMKEREWSGFIKDKSDVEILQGLIVGWDDMVDGGGESLKFNKKALEVLGENFWVSRAIFDVYVSAITGADQKNFSASLALGLAAKAKATQKPKAKKKPRRRS